MTPDKFLKYTMTMADNLADIAKKAAFVGLPKEKVGSVIYGNGETIFSVGAQHEFGAGLMPERSFLRTPFVTKRKQLNKVIAQQFKAVAEGARSPMVGLGRIGVAAVNVSKGAFTTKGYGRWADITDKTKQRKGSTQVLVDRGILRSSISYVVR